MPGPALDGAYLPQRCSLRAYAQRMQGPQGNMLIHPQGIHIFTHSFEPPVVHRLRSGRCAAGRASSPAGRRAGDDGRQLHHGRACLCIPRRCARAQKHSKSSHETATSHVRPFKLSLTETTLKKKQPVPWPVPSQHTAMGRCAPEAHAPRGSHPGPRSKGIGHQKEPGGGPGGGRVIRLASGETRAR